MDDILLGYVSIPQGTIKSAEESRHHGGDIHVSIPQGTIKRPQGAAGITVVQVSIPQGTIKRSKPLR